MIAAEIVCRVSSWSVASRMTSPSMRWLWVFPPFLATKERAAVEILLVFRKVRHYFLGV